MSWRDFGPQDNDPHWMGSLPLGSDVFGISAFGIYNFAGGSPEADKSDAEQTDFVSGQYAGRVAVQMEIAEASPLLRSEMPPHQWGEHPTELRDKLMQASLAAQTGEALGDRPARADVTNNMYGLFTVLAEHCTQNGADAFVSVSSLMDRMGLEGDSRYATARVYNIANPDLGV